MITMADSEPRASIVRKINYVVIVKFFDVNLRSNQNRFFGRVSTARIRIESTYNFQFLEQRFHLDANLLGKVWKLVLL